MELEAPDEETFNAAVDRVKTLGYLRFLYLLLVLRNGGEELLEIRVRHAAKHLRELLGRVDSLAI